MSLKKQIGQLLVVGYQGLEPSADFLSFVEEWGIGGVIFFVRNIDDPAVLPNVIDRLRSAANQTIFTCIDQEGGLVLRIMKSASLFPGPMALSATDSPDLTRRISAAIGREMRALGLNWNLAPVLDINHRDNPGIGARSFGDTPQRVAEYGMAAINGFREGGILSCAKHFPGKGDARVDSHLSLPTIPYDRERLKAVELFPFMKAIQAGVDAIMTAHVFFPAYESEPNLPGTLSEKVLTDLLRRELGFDGLLITDDLEMGAITETYGVADAARRSFLAGADLMLICHDLERHHAAAECLAAEVKNNPKAGRRLEESLARISRARKKLDDQPSHRPLDEWFREHAPLIAEASARSLLALPETPKALPIPPQTPILVAFPEVSALVQVEESHTGAGLGQAFIEAFPQAQTIIFHPKAPAPEILNPIRERLIAAPHRRPLIILSYNAHLFPGQREAFSQLIAEFPETILVALRNPFDLTAVSGATFGLATFGFRTPAIHAAIEVLQGKHPARTGPWPVTL
jgi:beta-N-acetylhexosaminidase